jgi:hypothetical protein
MTLIQFIRETKKWSEAKEKQLRNYVTKHPQSVQEASSEDSGASTPLIAAIEQKAPLSVIMYLVQMGGMNAGSPLSEAVQHENSLPVIKYLYTQNKDAIGDSSGGSLNYGWTPLMLAVSDGGKKPSPFEVISFLVENDNGQEHISNTGLTPLHIAFNSELDSEIIQYLILSFPQYAKERLDEFRELPVHLIHDDRRTLASLLFRAQLETDNGICFDDAESEPPWGGKEDDECGCVRDLFPLFCGIVGDMNEKVKQVKLESVQFDSSEWKLLLKTLGKLQHVETLFCSYLEVGDDFEETKCKAFGQEVNNPNITGKIEGKEISVGGGKRKRR